MVCTVEGCDRPHLARGLCRPHYEQVRRNGVINAEPVRPMRRTTACGREGCHKKRRPGSDYCAMHQRRLDRTGDIGPAHARHLRCLVVDCTEKRHAGGLCNVHFLAWRRHGDPLWTKPIPPYVDPGFTPEIVPVPSEVMAHLVTTLPIDEAADAIIRASCARGHNGKADIVTPWKQQQITRHEMAYDPFGLDWIAAA